MKLYILRHGDAGQNGDPHYPIDAERPLTAKGIKRTKSLAHALAGLDVTFDMILTSPLVRAKQTAEFVERGMKLHGQLAVTAHLAPTGDIEKLIAQLNGIRPSLKSVLLVGHEPYLSHLISLLLSGGPDLPVTLKKGGLCRMEVESLAPTKCATLEWLMSPRIFEPKRPTPKDK
jgi:phosphohistidine phosphatase